MKNCKKLFSVLLALFIIITAVFVPFVASAEETYNGYVKGSGVNMRKGPGTNYDKVCTTYNGQPLNVTGESTSAAGDKWYAVTLSSGEKGFIHSDYVGLNSANNENVYARVTSASTNMRSAPGTWNSKVITLSRGAVVKILGEALDTDGDMWYHAQAEVNSATYTGYVYNTTVELYADYVYDKAFEEYLTEQGFPESYKEPLRKLHALYPNWIFKADKLSVSWYDTLAAQTTLGRSLIQTSYPAWRSMQAGAYNFNTGAYTVFEGTNWYAADSRVVAYYLDPRNFLTTNNIFQFIGMSYDETLHTKESLQQLLNGTFMEGDLPEQHETYKTYSDVLIAAGKTYGMSPYSLAAMILLEQGSKGTGGSISGTIPGYEGYYNFLNINAYGSDPVINGLIYAKGSGSLSRPWNSRVKSIMGGAEFYAKDYIRVGQDTLYYKKFNVVSPPYNLHQYMTNVEGADKEGKNTKEAYLSMLDKALVFKIPVYKDIPETVMPYPSTSGDNNCYLDTLSIDGYSLSPTFDFYNNTYELIVDGPVKSIYVNAVPKNQNAKISGAGEHQLKVGTNKIEIKVTATSGKENVYTLVVVRGDYSEGAPEYTESYTFSENEVTGVAPGTEVGTLISKLNVKNGSAVVKNSKGESKIGNVATGDILVILHTDGSVFKSFTIIVKGDINGDGKISLIDLARVQRHILEIELQAGVYFNAADVSGDGKISLLDLAKVQRHLLEIELIK